MSRLGLRIFLAIFVALALFAVTSAGITSWLLATQHRAATQELGAMTAEAATALERDGEDGLLDWAARVERNARSATSSANPANSTAASDTPPRVLVLDEWGVDLLGREVPRELVSRFTAAHDAAKRSGDDEVRIGELPELLSADGDRYFLYALKGSPPVPGPFGLQDARIPLVLAALLLALLASSLLALSITRPVRALQRVTRDLAAGDLDVRVPREVTDRSDELGRLGSSFDSMAMRLGEALRARERLLRDVSHEIRSPLTRIRLATELARDGVGTELQLARIDSEVERLDALVGNILDVARLESGAEILRRDRLDLVTLIDRIAADAAFEAQARGCSVRWRNPADDCEIDGDADWTGAAIENVVRNALHHAPRDSVVELQLDILPGSYELHVRDQGPGVPEHELERIFEPFHRVAPDRSRDSGGAGLGLAITSRVMRAEGGGCRARNLDRGLEISLWWPRT